MTEQEESRTAKYIGLQKGKGTLIEKEKLEFILKVVREHRRKCDLYQEEVDRESKFLKLKIEKRDSLVEDLEKMGIDKSTQVKVYEAVIEEQERIHDVFSRVADLSVDLISLIKGIINDGYKKNTSVQSQDDSNPLETKPNQLEDISKKIEVKKI